jgi:ribose transport system substrate-binding protein
MKIRKILIGALLIASILSGCATAETNTTEVTSAPAGEQVEETLLSEVPEITKADKSWNVGLVYKGTNNEWSVTMANQAIDHAEEIGINLDAQGLATDNDIEAQINIVENMIAQKVDAIVIAPTDAKALVPAVVEAINAGIIVVNVDSQLDQDLLEEAGVAVPYVGPDNVAAGEASGGCLAREIPSGAKVIILEGEPGASNALQRKEGFMKAVEANNYEVVASETAHWDTNTAFTVFTDLLTANPDVQGVMAANDNMALGAIQAISAANKDIAVVGFDDISAAEAAIEAGQMICTINQFGGDVAAQGIDVAVAELQGAHFAGVVTTPFVLIDKDTLEASATTP